MARNNSVKGNFHYNNMEKQNKNFMYKNLTRSNCYNSSFAGSNFNFTSFRGAHFKSCDFYGCSFKQAEFIGTNFKNSKFRAATFENAIFDSVNLDGVDFRDAKFKNTIFVNTDVNKAKNLPFGDENVKVLDKMPELNISEELKEAVISAMENEFVKGSRVLDTKEGDLNSLNLSILLEQFSEESLIEGFKVMKNEIDREFWTLSYLFRFFK